MRVRGNGDGRALAIRSCALHNFPDLESFQIVACFVFTSGLLGQYPTFIWGHMPDIDYIRGEIERMRTQVGRQRKEILTLQRAGISTVSAEALMERMLNKIDSLCQERDKFKATLPSSDLVNELDRLEEPWSVVKFDDCFQVVDATGRSVVAVTHRQDLHKSRYTHAGNYLNAREAEAIANGVAKLRRLLLRKVILTDRVKIATNGSYQDAHIAAR